ncbi:hypothetical protein POUND7_013446 [Theobroma cacao]
MAVENINCSDSNNNNTVRSLSADEIEEFSSLESTKLCVPQDPLEDLDWLPDFTDEIISLDGFCLTPEHEINFSYVSPNSYEVPEQKTTEDIDDDYSAWESKRPRSVFEQSITFTKKKRRKRGGKRVWETRDFALVADDKEAIVVGEDWNCRNVRRTCSHCLSENTPQWRMGPSGPKTLCNACGVRYKSGRLMPEYRPAASPTFDITKHSNFHKKILKRKGFE